MEKVMEPAVAPMPGKTTAHAQTKSGFKYGLKEIAVAPFERVRINANLQVVLVHDAEADKVFLEGDQESLHTLSISAENGELTINPAPGFSGNEELLLTIPVSRQKGSAF
jgi:hypothetical protein